MHRNGVLKLLRDLKIHKATCLDEDPAFILKSAASQLAPILTRLYQYSLDAGEVPTDWKNAHIVPVFKKGEKHLPPIYRLVSLTSIVYKVLEHIVHSSMMTHFDRHKILTDNQHCFRAKTPHQRLLHKLDYYGVHNSTLCWIESFLHHRKQLVLLDGTKSSKTDELSGVPQGTVLGPLLF